MPPSPDQLKVARSWIGSEETTEVFSERFDRLGSLDRAIIESMRAQLADFVSEPASASAPSGAQYNTQANIDALMKSIRSFIDMGGTDGIADPGVPIFRVTQLNRPDVR